MQSISPTSKLIQKRSRSHGIGLYDCSLGVRIMYWLPRPISDQDLSFVEHIIAL